MALTRKPEFEIPYNNGQFGPPGWDRHKVVTGESWQSLADNKHVDVKALIYANFRTTDPKEINHYLKKFVGCTLETADGKNYRFSSDANPGYIFLPPADAPPPPPPPPPPGPTLDAEAKQAVIDTLTHWAVWKIDLSCLGITMSPDAIGAMAIFVACDKIQVYHNPNLSGGEAEYDSGENAFYLGFKHASSVTRKAIIVHEAVHAAFDYMKYFMFIGVSEAAAYLAQCTFVRAQTSGGGRLEADVEADGKKNNNKDRVFYYGWKLAGYILRNETPPDEDVQTYYQCIAKHPKYARNWYRIASFDGVG